MEMMATGEPMSRHEGENAGAILAGATWLCRLDVFESYDTGKSSGGNDEVAVVRDFAGAPLPLVVRPATKDPRNEAEFGDPSISGLF